MIIATLLYIKNQRGEYLLIERAKKPNVGLLSPPGGKLNMEEGESIFNCAVREAKEECNINSKPNDWKLAGIVTEINYPDIGNIMIFCLKYRKIFNKIPTKINEGKFRFVSPKDFYKFKLPQTDKLYIWKFVLSNKWFSIRIDCANVNNLKCIIENG